MKSAVAGTFSVLHKGHKELIGRAFEIGDEVFVGITSDEMIFSKDQYVSYDIRSKELIKYISTFNKPYRLGEIHDIYGPRDEMDLVEVLVVSEETASSADALNIDRIKRGIKPLKIDIIPLRNSDDGTKISSSKILSGEYGRNGNRNVKHIVVGSSNHVKIEAVRSVMEKILGDVRISSVNVNSGVPPQPFEEQTREGAINRAKSAMEDHYLSVGIEAGVFEKEDGLFDFQYCAILDQKGHITIGMGSGFKYPEDVSNLVRNGNTVGEAMRILYREDIGNKQGAIGILSKGFIDRKTLTEQSVTAAMIPRM